MKRVIDIRLNNRLQLAGFTKEEDLKYFLQAIAGIDINMARISLHGSLGMQTGGMGISVKIPERIPIV